MCSPPRRRELSRYVESDTRPAPRPPSRWSARPAQPTSARRCRSEQREQSEWLLRACARSGCGASPGAGRSGRVTSAGSATSYALRPRVPAPCPMRWWTGSSTCRPQGCARPDGIAIVHPSPRTPASGSTHPGLVARSAVPRAGPRPRRPVAAVDSGSFPRATTLHFTPRSTPSGFVRTRDDDRSRPIRLAAGPRRRQAPRPRPRGPVRHSASRRCGEADVLRGYALLRAPRGLPPPLG